MEAKLNKDTGSLLSMQVFCEIESRDGKTYKTSN